MEEHLYSILTVSSAEKFNTSIKELLDKNRFSPVFFAGDVAGARRLLVERSFDRGIINAPLPDEFGTRLALDICDSSGSGVLLLVKAEHYPDINARVSPYGVLTLSKPTGTQAVMQSLSLLCSTRERLRKMEQKAASFEEKMEEIRIVNRAKWLLIEQLKMTESEAHRYIEKQAMDRCVTRKMIAESILSTYK